MGNQLNRQWTAESNEVSHVGGVLKDTRLTAPPPSPSPPGRHRSPAPGSAVVWRGAGEAEGWKVRRTEGGRLDKRPGNEAHKSNSEDIHILTGCQVSEVRVNR